MTTAMTTENYLNQTVTVTVDRPLGSTHPKHAHIVYPINYGYIAGTTSGDGAELDAYILGVEEPVETFTGKVHAILRRSDDDDDKLIVAPPEITLTEAEIRQKTHFQEQYFHSNILFPKKQGLQTPPNPLKPSNPQTLKS